MKDTEKLGRATDLKEMTVDIYINSMLKIIQLEMSFK